MIDPIGATLTRRTWLTGAPAILMGRLTGFAIASPEPKFVVESLVEPRKTNFFHFVIAAEGFRENERTEFLKQAERYATAIRAQEPFTRFSDRIKLSVAWIASDDSGVQRVKEYDTESGQWFLRPSEKRTAFRSVLQAGRFVIEVGDFHAIRGVISAVTQPIDNLIVLVNDRVYGGGARAAIDMPAAAYHAHRTDNPISYECALKEFTFGLTVVSCEPKIGSRVLVHELGHSVANLGEEYFDPASAFEPAAHHPALKKPNVSVWSDPEKVKWKALIGRDRVGVFEGAEGFGRGLFRPWDDGCVMRVAEHNRFCPVCSTAISAEVQAVLDKRQ